MREILQDSTVAELSPEATAGFILAFVIVGFLIAVLGAFGAFLSSKLKVLDSRIMLLEKHPKLQKTDADLD